MSGKIITRILFLPFLCVLFISCFDDQGLVTPGQEGDLLGYLLKYQGAALNEGDTSISAVKLQNLINPKIALVWQFIGPTRHFITYNDNTIGTESPYTFSGTINNPPPREVIQSSFVAVATFWLYSDMDDNGVMDDFFDPDYVPMLDSIEAIRNLYLVADSVFIKLADIKHQPVPHQEYLLLGQDGSLISETSGVYDTLLNPAHYGLSSSAYKEVLGAIMSLLRRPSKWDLFFKNRHRSVSEETITLSPYKDNLQFITLNYYRRVFPLPGREAEFNQQLFSLVFGYLSSWGGLQYASRESLKKGWADYPFNMAPDRDWAIGRCRWYHIMYIPNSQEFQEVMNVLNTSSFVFSNPSRLRVGYNLMYCSDQYRCRVLGEQDSVYIDLGESYLYFNPPSSVMMAPSFNPVITSAPDTLSAQYSGSYQVSSIEAVSVLVSGGKVWMHYPSRGVYAFHYTGNRLYLSPIMGTQLEFVPGHQDSTAKLILYDTGFKAPAVRVSAQIPDSVNILLGALAGRGLQVLDTAGLAAWQGAYACNGDTAHIRFQGQSVLVKLPGLNEFSLYQASPVQGVEPAYTHPDISLTFQVIADSVSGSPCIYLPLPGTACMYKKLP